MRTCSIAFTPAHECRGAGCGAPPRSAAAPLLTWRRGWLLHRDLRLGPVERDLDARDEESPRVAICDPAVLVVLVDAGQRVLSERDRTGPRRSHVVARDLAATI